MPFCREVTPDAEGLLRCVTRQGLPTRVHSIELFLDAEIQDALCGRFSLLTGLDRADPYFEQRKQIALMTFLGYDYVGCGLEGLSFPLNFITTADSAPNPRSGGRDFIDTHCGPVCSWETFETYPWPDPTALTSRALEWYEKHLPENMCVIPVSGFSHFAEYLSWLMGYETLCVALCEQRDLVGAIVERLTRIFRGVLQRLLEFERVKAIWGSDDMGFRTGTLISPEDLREFVLPGHALMARLSHEAGRPYLLHSCGNVESIMADLIEGVGIDAKHSFEDTILPVIDAKREYGENLALLGGIDVDFLCRATEAQVRRRVRDTLQICLENGGYCLGTGNSVANYIPLDNYLAMLDEGRRFMG